MYWGGVSGNSLYYHYKFSANLQLFQNKMFIENKQHKSPWNRYEEITVCFFPFYGQFHKKEKKIFLVVH